MDKKKKIIKKLKRNIKIKKFILSHFLIIWFIIFTLILFFDFLLILIYTEGDTIKSIEYLLNFFFSIENPFIISNGSIIFLSYILMFFTWNSLPIVIIQLYHKKKLEKKEFYDHIENLIIEREFKRLRKKKGKEGINETEINKIIELSKIKIEEIKKIIDKEKKL